MSPLAAMARVMRVAGAVLLTLAAGNALPHGDGRRDATGAPYIGTDKPGLAASAAFDLWGGLWAVNYDGGYLVVRQSTDFGGQWSAPVRVFHAPEPMDTGGDAKPNIAIGPGGEIYVSWTRPLARPYTGEIRFARSVDRGRTFSPPRVVHADRAQITHRFDAMTVTRDGRLMIAWIDKRDGVAAAAKKGSYAGAATYYAVSDDRGATFRGDYKVADHSCECCRISLLPLDDGSVLGLWRHVFAPNVRDHAVARLGSFGNVSDFRRVTFDEWRVDVCPHHGPTLAADADRRLHAVWYTGATGKEGVYYGRLTDAGVEGQRRVGGDTAEHADLAIAGDELAIVWKEFDGRRTTLRALRSGDRGATFTERELAATTEASDQPHLLVRGGHFYVFWNSLREPLRVVPLP